MLTAQSVKDHLPVLRRYARALTGSQESGDNYVAAALEALTEQPTLIDEKTSKMVEMKNPCIILDGAVCQARYSPCRMLCPKSMYPYWREIWLERVEAPVVSASSTKNHDAGCIEEPSLSGPRV